MPQILDAFREAASERSQPVMIVARTLKGKGISLLEDADGRHGEALDDEQWKRALGEFSNLDREVRGTIAAPEDRRPARVAPLAAAAPSYETGQAVATRTAYGAALTRIAAAFPHVVSLDGEVSNSTMADMFKAQAPARFFEMFIAEQNMVEVALGLSLRGQIPFVSTFAAFFARAFDHIRMSQYSQANVKFVGSHAGVSIGEDGASQMGLEDIAMFRSVLTSTVLHPCDATSTERLVEAAAAHNGIVYLRTMAAEHAGHLRQRRHLSGRWKQGTATGTLRPADARRRRGHGARALKAYEQLQRDGITVRVIDAYSIKPIDAAALRAAADATGLIVTIEDHYPAGGLGEAVLQALADRPVPVTILAVTKTPMSGTGEELCDFAGISAAAIVRTVQSLATTEDAGATAAARHSSGLEGISARMKER